MVAINGTVRRWCSPVAAAGGSCGVAEEVSGEGCGDGAVALEDGGGVVGVGEGGVGHDQADVDGDVVGVVLSGDAFDEGVGFDLVGAAGVAV